MKIPGTKFKQNHKWLFSGVICYFSAKGDSVHHFRVFGLQPNASHADIRSQYMRLCKQYHPDLTQDPKEKQILEEKFKEINESFQILSKLAQEKEFPFQSQTTSFQEDFVRPKKPKRKRPMTPQDEIYQEVFGKQWEDDPLEYYKEINAVKRENFNRKMKEKGFSTYSNYEKDNHSWEKEKEETTMGPGYSSVDESAEIHSILLGFATGLAVLLGFFMFHVRQQQQMEESTIKKRPSPIIEEEEIAVVDMLRSRYIEKIERKRNDFLEIFHSDENRMKVIKPGRINLSQLLVNYSIFPDVNFWAVDHKPFYRFSTPEEALKQKIEISNMIGPHTKLTHALEFERTLKYVFIKAGIVENELRNKGYFQCPNVFFRYHGYLVGEVRKMPVNKNWRRHILKGGYVSLFDVFFEYESPIWKKFPFKSGFFIDESFYQKDSYRSYGKNLFGEVHFNHRPLRTLLIDEPGTKFVFMWKGREPIGQSEALYRDIWDNFYNLAHTSIKTEDVFDNANYKKT